MSDSIKLRPALGRLVSDGKAAMALTGAQRESLQRFMTRVKNREYDNTPHPCLCGEADDVLIACKDRYGIPLRTLLCKGCGLMRSDPYLSPDALVKFYQHEYRGIYEASVFPICNALVRMVVRGEHIYRFLHKHDVKIPENVFELGCGTGGNLIPFLLQNHVVAGCDHGGDFLEMGRKLGLDLREGGIEMFGDELPHSLIILCHVLEHLRDPINELTVLRNLLPEGSLVYVEVPGIYSIGRSYRDPLLFLQNAHSYHFCLKSLDYVLGLASFERIYGNERIEAIYCLNLSLQPPIPGHKLYQQVLSYLKRTDRLRWLPRHPLRLLVRWGRALENRMKLGM